MTTNIYPGRRYQTEKHTLHNLHADGVVRVERSGPDLLVELECRTYRVWPGGLDRQDYQEHTLTEWHALLADLDRRHSGKKACDRAFGKERQNDEN